MISLHSERGRSSERWALYYPSDSELIRIGSISYLPDQPASLPIARFHAPVTGRRRYSGQAACVKILVTSVMQSKHQADYINFWLKFIGVDEVKSLMVEHTWDAKAQAIAMALDF